MAIEGMILPGEDFIHIESGTKYSCMAATRHPYHGGGVTKVKLNDTWVTAVVYYLPNEFVERNIYIRTEEDFRAKFRRA
jgi:hypothetical protein